MNDCYMGLKVSRPNLEARSTGRESGEAPQHLVAGHFTASGGTFTDSAGVYGWGGSDANHLEQIRL